MTRSEQDNPSLRRVRSFGVCRPACGDSMKSWAAASRNFLSTSSLAPPGAARPRWRIRSFSPTPPERPALYFTVLGEPTLKMLRYQRQFSFFDAAKLEDRSVSST